MNNKWRSHGNTTVEREPLPRSICMISGYSAVSMQIEWHLAAARIIPGVLRCAMTESRFRANDSTRVRYVTALRICGSPQIPAPLFH